MKHSLFGGMILGSALCLATFTSFTFAASYDITWEGADGYSMSGQISHADSLIGSINGAQVDSFSIEGFQHGTSVGSWNLPAGQAGTTFNFNFDTNTGTFLTGGRSDTPTGQLWNVPTGDGFGFFSGNSSQGLYVNGFHVASSQLIIGSTVTTIGLESSTLRATLNSTPPTSPPGGNVINPEPSTILLFGTGFGTLLAYRLRKQRTASS
ncbi:PEP-CTERM sorting domain-containing protein [Nitrospira sp. M1]